MVFLLSACILAEPAVQPTAPPSGTPQPGQPQPAGQPTTPNGVTMVPRPQGTPPAAGDPQAPRPQGTWTPAYPYVSQNSAPSWPDPTISYDTCQEMTEGGPVMRDGCVTGEITCGDRITGHTIGGVDRFDGRFYQSKFCFPNFTDHDGGDERVYRLTMPEGEWRTWVTLYSPCADLTLTAIEHNSRTCPTASHSIRRCEQSPKEGTMTERLELVTQSKPGQTPTWYVVVEGAGQDEGPFELIVQCHPGLGGTVPKSQ